MNFIEKRLFLKSGLIFCLIQIILYVPIHLSYTDALNGLGGGAVVIGALSSALSELASFILPLAAACILFVSYAFRGAFHAIPRVLVFSLPYILGTAPEYYLVFLQAFDSLGALFFAVIYSLIIFAAVTAQMLLLFGIICFFFRFPQKDRFGRRALEPLCKEDMFDFSEPFAKGLFAAVLVQFAVALVPEIIDTVKFIVNNRGTILISEILTILFTFVFIVFEMIVSYIFVYKLKNKLLYERLSED